MDIDFDKFGRMKYNPKLHPNQGKSWTMEDVQYLINWIDKIGYEEMSLALGRTEATVADKVHKLKKKGLMENVKKQIHHPRLLRRCESEQFITY